MQDPAGTVKPSAVAAFGRRTFLSLGAAALMRAQGQKRKESATARATADETPRVGIVLSTFAGSQDHDGTTITGLAEPRPVTADLTDAQLDAMVCKAIDIGGRRRGNLSSVVGPEDWVVIKPDIGSCFGLGPEVNDGGAHHRYVPGTVTDLRVVRAVIQYLLDRKRGLRFSIAEGSGEWLPKNRSKSAVDGWTTDWGGAFGGLSYRSMVDDLSRRYPAVKFETVDLNFEETLELPVQGKLLARNNRDRAYHIPKTIQQCDKLITVAPLKTDAKTGVSLGISNYFGIAPGSKYGFPKKALYELGQPEEVMLDLFGYRPADYAVLGGCWGVAGDGPSAPGAEPVHHNLIVAGANAVAVDAVGAAVMGFDPTKLRYLELANRQGFGIFETDLIWTRGNEIDEARHAFRKPSGWA